ncbi:TniQ family protein [Paenibacillus alba]|uniref:TnsD family Tn7-like transposition protein n=1 Tax=Paenibacillus alba TaxID=1197127 RepID=UPI001566D162|nr:TnsD family Tn7-like transposition protein [Paenibacillus alba]NQX71811.1 TniQ family protein [Paenibacillus alba]
MNEKTLSFFPSPYPDEDFRSVIYRYHLRTLNKNYSRTKQELFNFKSNKINCFPRNLSFLISQLPIESGLSEEYIINNHTLLPLFILFMSERRRQQVIEDIVTGTENVKSYAGKLSSLGGRSWSHFSEHIQYCQACMKNSYHKYGEIYVHRIHQLEFISVCPMHRLRLISHCPHCGVVLSKPKSEWLPSIPCCINGHDLTNPLPSQVDLCDWSENFNSDSKFLLKYYTNFSNDHIYQKIIGLCWNKGYFTYSGKVRIQTIQKDFLSYYPSDFLNSFSFISDLNQPDRFWRIALTKGYKLQNIAFYLLLIRFLAGSVEEFINSQLPNICYPIPFGNGPWSCINTLCNDYNKKGIKSCDRSNINSSIMQVRFACPKCGSRYTWKWDLKNQVGRKPVITYRGDHWNKTILKLYSEGMRLKEISEKLGITMTNTHLSIERLTGLILDRETDKDAARAKAHHILENDSISIKAAEKISLKEHRERILSIINEEPYLSRLAISKKARTSYSRLMKIDREWMENSLPQVKRSTSLDFDILDKEFTTKVKQVCEQLYNSNPRNRIKRNTVLSLMDSGDISMIKRHLMQLPRTALVLLEYEETNNNFLERRLPRDVAELIRRGYRNVTLKSLAAFRPAYRNISDEMMSILEGKLREYKDGQAN